MKHSSVFTAMTAVWLAGAAAPAADWPTWQYDAARSGAPPSIPAEELHLQWVRELPAPQRAWPRQQDDRGKLDFDVSYTPVVLGRRVFVASMVTDSVTAYCLDSGEQRWRFYTDGPVRLAPAAWNGRVYFGSDDGHFYCVDAEGGGLVWKVRAGPSDKRLLGNERIISFWAARGAPVVKDGTVYFAAGIWPLHGVFIHAVDAESGDVVWMNDTTSSDYVQLPHGGATGYGGLSPQGYIAASEDRLVVAGGRSPPAFLNRHTGEVESVAFRAKPEGGYAVHAVGKGGLGMRGNKAIDARVAALADRIDGEVFYQLVAHGRLLVTTEDGKLYCFGPEEAEAVHHRHTPQAPVPTTTAWADVASGLLEELGESDGYALMLGAGSGDLLRELLARSGLHIVVAEANPQKVRALREDRAAADVYGRRAAVIEADPATFAVQPYLFSMVLSEDAGSAGIGPEAAALRPVLNRLRPYGGIAWLGAANDAPVLARAAAAAAVDRVAAEDRGDHLFARRGGPLTGAGQWTHQYASASQTNFSPDHLARAPLGVLWFGGPCNSNILPRHGHGPVPQAAAGRVVVPGADTISARCAYTGREMWVSEFPGIGHPFTGLDLEAAYRRGQGVHMATGIGEGANQLGSPFVTLPDAVYVRYKTRVYRLDPKSGERVAAFQIPVEAALEGKPDWGHLSVWDDLILVTVRPQTFDDGQPRRTVRAMDDIQKTANRTPEGTFWDATSSERLVVMDRHTGKVLWTRDAAVGFRHNAIVPGGGRLYLIDGLSPTAVDLLRRRGEQPGDAALLALDPHTGRELWKRDSGVFGTWLGYAEEADVLLEAGRPASWRGVYHNRRGMPRRPVSESGPHLGDEPNDRIAAYEAATGAVRWDRNVPVYGGPPSLRGTTILLPPPGSAGRGHAVCLATGEPKMREQPHTTESAAWTYSRRYGCNSHNVSEHLILFRSGYAAYYDLANDSGTGFLAGFRAGCTNNLVVADGVVSAPDYTRTCHCSYALQTSLGLIHMPDDPNVEFWTRYDGAARNPAGFGVNFGAPGRRVDASGLVWHDEPGTHRRHSSAVGSWVAATAREGEGIVALDELDDGAYEVRLHFAELSDDVKPGQRAFDVFINNEKVLDAFDIVDDAGAAMRETIKSFRTSTIGGRIEIELRTSAGSDLEPLVAGVAVEKLPERALRRAESMPATL